MTESTHVVVGEDSPALGRPPRQKHEPRERAQYALDLALRKVGRLQKRLDQLTELQHKTAVELGNAQTEREYAEQHPLLRNPEPEAKSTASVAAIDPFA